MYTFESNQTENEKNWAKKKESWATVRPKTAMEYIMFLFGNKFVYLSMCKSSHTNLLSCRQFTVRIDAIFHRTSYCTLPSILFWKFKKQSILALISFRSCATPHHIQLQLLVYMNSIILPEYVYASMSHFSIKMCAVINVVYVVILIYCMFMFNFSMRISGLCNVCGFLDCILA